MGALADPNTHLLGVYGSDDEMKDTLLQRVYRRVQRDQQFGMVVTATVTKNPDVRKIQEDIAHQLGFTFNQKSNAGRAKEFIRRIKNEQTTLFVLRDLYERVDLSKVGIPYGADHTGCKLLLTSTTADVLSNQMHTQKNIMVI
ncbi:disease resistance protein RPS5-like [Neltuma alba]|uniref:disease resistance protein RPS5-like n=1 Tax=Neltuma alba TaxID=207710 RepID=UPI0010A58B7B|nr:disease resistance protein RPS5-like [Prosopis alba]